MTIRKGQAWGSMVVPGPGMCTVRSDAELRELVLSHWSTGQLMPVVGLLGGDLMRTLGGTAESSRFSGDAPIPHLPIDVVRVTTDDGRESIFVAHLIARSRSWWYGPIAAVMNAQFHRHWDVAPRAHPNDGRVDVVKVAPELTIQQRWLARSRLKLGTHMPHPLITVKQRDTETVDFGLRRRLWLDGQRWGTAQVVDLTVEPDAVVVCV